MHSPQRNSSLAAILTIFVYGTFSWQAAFADEPKSKESPPLLGYTELQTNLPGARQANVRTMRARLVLADGTGARPIGEKLIDDPNAWTQFAGWSPDGKTAIVGRGWESPSNAHWEEE